MQIKSEDAAYNGSTNLYTQGFESEVNGILLELFNKNDVESLSTYRKKIENIYTQYCKDTEDQKHREEIQKDLSAYKVTALTNLENFIECIRAQTTN
ncbi:MAG: hypothetical protein SNF33_03415 [Candidatus Algichlamydia australiensis]|nr:hypothetical protein [Chlamydiales bacterium]